MRPRGILTHCIALSRALVVFVESIQTGGDGGKRRRACAMTGSYFSSPVSSRSRCSMNCATPSASDPRIRKLGSSGPAARTAHATPSRTPVLTTLTLAVCLLPPASRAHSRVHSFSFIHIRIHNPYSHSPCASNFRVNCSLAPLPLRHLYIRAAALARCGRASLGIQSCAPLGSLKRCLPPPGW